MNETELKNGKAAEKATAEYLVANGWRILNTNYRTSRGEIDIVAVEGDCLVFVEVKSGRKGSRGIPALRVGPVKQRRLILAARQYITDYQPTVAEYRFDVASLIPKKNGEWQIEHLRDAFRPAEDD